MADVDMADAPAASSASKAVGAPKKSASGEGASDGKKRFEVKKVMCRVPRYSPSADMR
jgi:hypothetical protein